MALQQFLKSLGIVEPTRQPTTGPAIHGLLMDDDMLVDVTQVQNQIFFVSIAPELSDQSYLAHEQIKKAMAWSLAREPEQTCLAQESNHLLVQTMISADSTCAELTDALNGHCRFIDKLKQLTLSSEAKAYQHDVILP